MDRSEIVKGYEYEPERYVSVAQEELSSLRPANSTEAAISSFAKLSEIDPVFFETSYYVQPDRGGENAYSLLFTTLQRTGYCAIAQVTMHRREHIVVVRPATKGLILHTMYYLDEVRQDMEFSVDASGVKDKELRLATTLVEALAEKFDPAMYHDTYRARLQALIANKLEGASAQEPSKTVKGAPVVDILEALQKSLASARKPVKSASAPASPKRKAR